MTTALEDGSAASPGQKSLSSHSRDSSFRQAWKTSGGSPLPFEDIFEDPTGGSGTPPDSSRPSSRNTDSSGAEQPTTALETQRGAPQDALQSAVDGAENTRPADGLPGEAQNAADAERHSRHAAADSRAPPKRKDQFTMEILRCRAVAPDWQDTSAASSGPYWDRQHALTLNVPQLLLQLPPTNPAKHPSKHPVEVHSFDSASASAPAAQDDAEEGSKHESSTPSIPTYETSAQQEPTVITAVQLAFHVEVFDPGKASRVGYTSPFISIPEISMTYQGLQPVPSVTPDASASRPDLLPATRLQIPNAIFDVAPGRLAVLLAAITWAQGELAHILGQTAEQTPHQHRPPAMPLMSRLMRLSPVIAVATVQKCSLRLRGASPMQPALQLDMTGLEAEAVRLPEEAVGLRVKLPQLLFALRGLPESSDAEESAPESEGLEKASRSPKGLGRSASAPSPPLMRAETPSLKLEVVFSHARRAFLRLFPSSSMVNLCLSVQSMLCHGTMQYAGSPCMAHLPIPAICAILEQLYHKKGVSTLTATFLCSPSRPGCLMTQQNSRAAPLWGQTPRPSASWETGQRPPAWLKPPCWAAVLMRPRSRSSQPGRPLGLSAPWACSENPLKVCNFACFASPALCNKQFPLTSLITKAMRQNMTVLRTCHRTASGCCPMLSR